MPAPTPFQLISVDLSSGVAAIMIGVVLLTSIAFYLATNLSPCGLITPAYLVLCLVESPWSLTTVLGGTATLYAATWASTKVMILYGKRLFAVTMTFGILIQTGTFLALHGKAPHLFPGDALSFITPGLIVYQLIRQKKPLQTLGVTAAVAAFGAALVFGALALPV